MLFPSKQAFPVTSSQSLPLNVDFSPAHATTPKFSFSVPHCAHDAMMRPHFRVVERPQLNIFYRCIVTRQLALIRRCRYGNYYSSQFFKSASAFRAPPKWCWPPNAHYQGAILLPGAQVGPVVVYHIHWAIQAAVEFHQITLNRSS